LRRNEVVFSPHSIATFIKKIRIKNEDFAGKIKK